MDVVNYSRVRSHFAETMDRVCEDHAPVIITRGSDRAVVMISLADYESMEETSYLLRSPKNAQRLMESIAEMEDGGGQVRELID